MLDHYYDKLLHVARPPPRLVRNAYLEAEAEARVAPLLQVSVARWQNLIPSFPWFAPRWRAWGAQSKEREGSNFAAQRSGAIVQKVRRAKHIRF